MNNTKLAALAARVATGVAGSLTLSGVGKRLVLLAVQTVAEAGLQELWHRLLG